MRVIDDAAADVVEVLEAGNRTQAFCHAAYFRTVAFIAEKDGLHRSLDDSDDFPQLTSIRAQPPGRPLDPLRRRVRVWIGSFVDRRAGNRLTRLTTKQAVLRAVKTRAIVFHFRGKQGKRLPAVLGYLASARSQRIGAFDDSRANTGQILENGNRPEALRDVDYFLRIDRK